MSRVRITACRDFPGHAHRVTRTACERCGGTRLVQKMSGPAPCPRCAS